MWYEEILLFIINPPDTFLLRLLKFLFISFSLVLFFLIIFFAFLRSSWFKSRFLVNFFEFFTYRAYGTKNYNKEWKKIKDRLNTGLESEYKLAIIEADSLLNNILSKMGYSGASLGERLDKISPTVLSNIEEIRQAHQTRNNIVHDPNYVLSLEETKNTLSIFEKTLIDLGAL